MRRRRAWPMTAAESEAARQTECCSAGHGSRGLAEGLGLARGADASRCRPRRPETRPCALIDRFKGALLANIEFVQICNQVFALLRACRHALPPDDAAHVLTAEGFVRALAPDIVAELTPIARELLAEQASSRGLLAAGRKAAGAFTGRGGGRAGGGSARLAAACRRR